jgi:predicted amidohydrolase YtcJ
MSEVVYISFLFNIFIFKWYGYYITIFNGKGDIMLIREAHIYNPIKMQYDEFDMRITKNRIADLQPWRRMTPQENEAVVDWSGKYIYPGFIDSHCHLMGIGEKHLCPSLLGVDSKDVFYQIIKNHLKRQEFVLLRGWDEEKVGFVPTRSFLDTVSTIQPIILIRKCGHIATANSSAIHRLHLSGLDGVDKTSLQEGTICETALIEMRQRIPQNIENEKRYLIEGAKRFLQYGVTSVHSEDWNPQRMHCFFQRTEFQLPCRLFEKVSIHNLQDLRHWIQNQANIQNNPSKSFIHTNLMIKIYMDGSICGKTAHISTFYKNTQQNGVCYHSVDTLKQIIHLANENHLQVCIHTIGDQALDKVLKSFSSNLFSFLRHRIIHAQFASPNQIKEMKEKQLELSIQPCFYNSDLPTVQKILEPTYLANKGYPYRSYEKENLLFSLSTDAPVESENPFQNIACAEEFMSRKRAFYAYTISGARQVYQENSLGILAKGYIADFFVLNRDLFRIPRKEMASTIPEKVFLDGKEMIGDVYANTI